MAAAAHNPEFAKKVGIPQKVAKDFNAADAKTGILRTKKSRYGNSPTRHPKKASLTGQQVAGTGTGIEAT